MARSKRSKRCTRKKSQKTRNYRACRARQEWLSKDDKVSRSPNLKLKQKLNLYILRHRKKLVDDLADEFDEVYANLAVKEESLFEDPVTTKKFQDVTFSSTAMHIGCGMVRLNTSLCNEKKHITTTCPLSHEGCHLIKEFDRLVPTPVQTNLDAEKKRCVAVLGRLYRVHADPIPS
jgi:hypothetical protein